MSTWMNTIFDQICVDVEFRQQPASNESPEYDHEFVINDMSE
jgi:hypothetical protein